MAETSAVTDRWQPAEPSGQDRPGSPEGWRPAVLVVAAALLVVGLVWRARIGARGYLALDDYALAARALDHGLTSDYLLKLFNNHLMPGGLAIYWWLTRWTGLAYWPYLLLALFGQAVTSVVFCRLLYRMLRPGWALLVPLAMFLFSPITLESTSWPVVAVNVVPMQLAMVWAISAQVGYVRTGRRWQLASLVLAVAFGLLFFEKSLLIVPLVFLVTVCLYTEGGPVASLWRAVRRYWPSWLALSIVTVGYLALYSSVAANSVRQPSSPREVVGFLGQLFGRTLVPGLLGGPWRWQTTGDGPPIADPAPVLTWISWAVMLLLVVGTVARRRIAVRAWLLLLLYAAMVAALLSATRLGAMLSAWAGLVPRYLSDVVIVAALCTGVAVCGLRPADGAAEAASRWRTSLWRPGAVRTAWTVLAAGCVVAAGLGTAWSGTGYGDAWSVKAGRDYLHTAQADLGAAPPNTYFFDELVPASVVEPYWFPDTLQSRFFGSAKGPHPVFVTEGEQLSVLTDDGHIRSAWVVGRSIAKGPAACGWEIKGGTPVTIPLDGPLYVWGWTVRIAYLSPVDSTATFRLGGVSRDIPIRAGLHQYYFLLNAGGESVELTLHDPAVSFCTNAIAVGETVPGL